MVKLADGADLNNKELVRAVLQSAASLTVAKQIGYDNSVGSVAGREKGLAWYDATLGAVRRLSSVALDELSALTADKTLGSFTFQTTKSIFTDNDIVNKKFVTDLFSTAHVGKEAVKAAFDSVLTLTTDYTRTGTGSTHIITASANGALSVDGITTFTDMDNDGGVNDPFSTSTRADRILGNTFSDAKDNGVYVVKDKGSAGTPWKLQRATDFDGTPSSEVRGGASVWVTNGTNNANKLFTVSGDGDRIVDTDNINFIQGGGAGSYTEGVGIDIQGTMVNFSLASNITQLTDPIATTDRLAVYDDSTSTQKYVTLSDLLGSIADGNYGLISNSDRLELDFTSFPNSSTTSGAADVFALYDATTDGRMEKITKANLVGSFVSANTGLAASNGVLNLDLNNLNVGSVLDLATDLIAYVDGSETGVRTRKMNIEEFLYKSLSGTTSMTTLDDVSDLITITDVTGTVVKKITLANLLTELAGSGLTYNSTEITLEANKSVIPRMQVFSNTTTSADNETFTHNWNTTNVGALLLDKTGATATGMISTWTNPTVNSTNVVFGEVPSGANQFTVLLVALDGNVADFGLT